MNVLAAFFLTRTFRAATVLAVLVFSVTANAAYLLEIDTDGTDNGVLTLNSHFSF